MSLCLALLSLGWSAELPGAEEAVQARTTVRAVPATGRLARTTALSRPAAKRKSSPPPEVDALVRATAVRHQMDPLLVRSVIRAESNFDPLAVSPKGAQGLMQLIPSTARRFGALNAFDARENIEAGVRYLRYLKDLLQDDRLALAAYNAGEGAVMKYGGVPPYEETRKYVEKVQRDYEQARGLSGADVPASDLSATEPQFRSVELFTDEQGRIHLRTRP